MADFVYYRTAGGDIMRAAVRTRHRDGDLSVEPFIYQDTVGQDRMPFQGGFTVRVPTYNLTTATGGPVADKE